jgi:hypothetical protein
LLGVLALALVLVATTSYSLAGVQDASQSEPGAGDAMQNLAAAPETMGVNAPEAVTALPTGTLSYQGLLELNGSRYNGMIDITFRLYTTPSDGFAWWEETQLVQVQDGLFHVMLGAVVPLEDLAVQFQYQQWLGIQPAGAPAELAPRQALGAAGYAFNLMPGATMVDANPAGVYGYSLWVSSTNHNGLYAGSGSGTGVYGSSSADEATGVYGSASGTGNSSHGLEASMSGSSASCPSGETECGSALYARASGDAYGAFVSGDNRSAYIGIQGDNGYYGLWLDSLISPDGNGIWTDGASYFGDYVTFGGGKSGYVVDIALNDGPEPLEQGDVVVISGYAAPVVGNIPVVRVRRAGGAGSSAVMGVVDVRYVACAEGSTLEAGQACGGFQNGVTTIQPGEYLSVVTLGAYEAVKVDATAGPIRPGDLLATSASRGMATKAIQVQVEGVSFHAPGTIIGKALGNLESGTGVIPVFVSSR